MASIQYLHPPSFPLNRKWGGDRGSKIPPSRTLHSWLLSPFISWFLPINPISTAKQYALLRYSPLFLPLPALYSPGLPPPILPTAITGSQWSDNKVIRIENIITLIMFSKIAGSASRQDEHILSRFVSLNEFPLTILLKITGYVNKWMLWNSTAKLCDGVKSFLPLWWSIRTKLKPTATFWSSFSRAWSDLLTLASSSDWLISIPVRLSTNHRLNQNQSQLAWALSSRSWRDLQKMPTSPDCLMKIFGRIVIGFYKTQYKQRNVKSRTWATSGLGVKIDLAAGADRLNIPFLAFS